MRTKLFILFFILAKAIHAQHEDNEIGIKICPLALLDPWNHSTVKMGMEFKVSGNSAVYGEMGTYITSYAGKRDKGLLADIEFKHYLNDDFYTSGKYISLELFYKNQTYRTSDSIAIYPHYEKIYDVHKSVECCTFKFGGMKVFECEFIAEAFFGLGIRIKNATSTLTVYENQHIQSSADYGPNLFANQSGHFIYPNIDIGVKIGYRLK
jgi:hypothetical protein